MSINKKLQIIAEKVGANSISVDLVSYRSSHVVWVHGDLSAHQEVGESGEKLSQTMRRAIENAKNTWVI